MLRNIRILIKADCCAWWNSLRYDKQAWRKSIFKAIGYLVFITSLSVLGWTLFSHLKKDDASSHITFSVLNGFMVFGIIIVAKELMESSLKILYEATDTQMLYTAPIRPLTIFGYKFIHITISRLMSMLCFLGPPWVVFGLTFQLPWHYYAVLLPVSIGLLVLLASNVTISMMVIARFFSSSGLLTTLKTLGTIIGVMVGFFLSFMLFAGSDAFPVKNYILNLASTGTADTTAAWYPHEWIGQLLVSWGNETTVGRRLRWILGGFAISMAAVALAFLTAQWIYQSGWENIRQLETKRKPARKNSNNTTSHINGLALLLGRGKIQSLMLKDFLIYIRHTGRVVAIIMLTCFLVIHISVLFLGGAGPDEYTTEILSVQILLYSLLITFGISCNGLRDEAKTWWMMKSAPVKPNLLFNSKFMIALLCALLYAEFWSIIAIYLLRIHIDSWVILLLMPIITLPTGCALNTTIGTLPWMAELTNQPKPLLRVLTFTATLFFDIAIIIAPIVAWHSQKILIFFISIVLLAAMFVILYSFGVRNLRRLLVPQE